MLRKEVESSTIKSIGYDPETRVLEVEFKRAKAIYQYHPITEECYNELMNAGSIGTYFHVKIKSNSLVTTTKL